MAASVRVQGRESSLLLLYTFLLVQMAVPPEQIVKHEAKLENLGRVLQEGDPSRRTQRDDMELLDASR